MIQKRGFLAILLLNICILFCRCAFVNKTEGKDGAEMVFVPAGEFTMGNSGHFNRKDSFTEHTVYLDDFKIDKTEVTNAQYQKCIDAKVCAESKPKRVFSKIHGYFTSPNFPAEKDSVDYFRDPRYADYPVMNKTWTEAQAYCEWIGGSLPTEAQWEKAARGTDGRIFPWGTEHSKYGDPLHFEIFLSRTNDMDRNERNNGVDLGADFYATLNRRGNFFISTEGPVKVGSYPDGASPYGALDMAGNVWEYVYDFYQEDYYLVSPEKNPQGPNGGNAHVVRDIVIHYGNGDSEIAGSFARESMGVDQKTIWLGFRCVKPGK